MKVYIPKILSKPLDYWVCKRCNGLNWYENEECTGENQGCECEGKQPKLTNKRDEKVLKWAETEAEDCRDIVCSNCECEEGKCEFNKDDLNIIEIYI